MSRDVTIATAQPLRRRPSEEPMTVDKNLRQAKDLIDRAPPGTDVICFPETFSIASIEAEKEVPHEELAKHTPRFLDVLGKKAAARSMNAVLCLPADNGTVTFIVDRTGEVVGQCMKPHITYGSVENGRAKGDSLPVFELDFGRIGVLVCYDLYFPEHARCLALDGAEILFHPTRIMNAPSERAFESLCIARAVENVCWFVASSFAPPPPYRYGSWQARSFIVDPYGTILAEAGREPNTLAAATVDLDLQLRRPEGFLWTTFKRLRRPELYGQLTDRS